MNDLKIYNVVNNDKQPTVKDMAYGGGQPISSAVIWSNIYRLRRGFPLPRRGSVVVATPQFKTLTLYSPTIKTQQMQIPGSTLTPVAINYPRKTR